MFRPFTSSLYVLVLLASVFTWLQPAQAVPLTGGMGPGGVGVLGVASSGPVLWLNPDTISQTGGTKVNTWNDISTYGKVATADAGSLNTFQPNSRNGFATVRLPGAVDAREFTVPSVSGRTYIAALVRDGNFNCCDGLFGEVGADVGSDNGLRSDPGSAPSWQPTGTIGSAGVDVNGTGTASFGAFGNWHVVQARSSTEAAHANLGIGQYYTLKDREIHGNLGEVVVYTQDLNVAQRQILNSYYGAKYDFVVTNDRYTGDNPGIDFDRDVFGVGRIDGSNQQTMAGAAGFGIQVNGGVAGSELNDGEFVLAGHNTPSATIVDLSSAFSTGERWSRVWNVDTNGSETDAIFGFNFDDAGLGAFFDAGDNFQLLYSSDASFSSYEILDLDFSIDGNDTISFNVTSDLLLDGFYTLGANIGSIPEPGSFTLLLGLAGLGLIRRRRG